MRTLIVLFVGFLFTSPVAADVKSDLRLLGSYRSEGVYDLGGLGSWNGQPVTPTNRPSDSQAQLATTINFYGVFNDHNRLFVQIDDVITTTGSWWTGLAFENVSQTGIRFTLPSKKELLAVQFSDQYANPGEVLFTGNGSETVPLDTTPGYELDTFGNNVFSIHTANGAEYAFGTWGYVNGARRIMGGGLFELEFSNDINVKAHIDFSSATVESIYGRANQSIVATWQGSNSISTVPEPTTLVFLGTIILTLSIHQACTLRRGKTASRNLNP